MRTEVSVVIPAFNAEDFIVDALNSIVVQTYSPVEVIVVNDGSTDQTAVLVEEWVRRTILNFPVYLSTQKNRGLPAARNAGIYRATGKWIALLDADDVWESGHLENLVAAVSLCPWTIAAYGAGRLLVDGRLADLLYDDFWDNPSKAFGVAIAHSENLLIDSRIFPRLLQGNFIKPSSLMFLRIIKGDLVLFNESLRTAEDREFLARLIRIGEFVYIPKAITQYRWHAENISQKKNFKRNAENSIHALKIIRDTVKPQLTIEQFGICERQMHIAIKEYLFTCSLLGVIGYVKGLMFVKNLLNLWWAIRAFNLKHVIRSLFSETVLMS